MRVFAISFSLGILIFMPVFAFANIAPVANPGGPYLGVTQKPILFDGSASSDADGDFLEYSWNFGDGSTGIGDTPFHTYAVPGVFTVSLTVNDGAEDSTPAETTATITIAAPKHPIAPEDEAKSVELLPGPVLVLKWEAVAGAQTYRYQYWKQGDAIPGPDEHWTEVAGTQSNPIPASSLTPGAQYFWYVRACANSDGDPELECGSYSEDWNFTYLLSPPEILTPTSGNTGLPVRFTWEEVTGAESYLFRGEIDFSTSKWGHVKNFVNFISNPTSWFFTFALNFVMERLGLAGEAIGCPAALWDENAADQEIPCVDVTANRDPVTKILVTEYIDAACTFTKETKYTWYVATCLGPGAQHCGKFSDKESFETNDVHKGVSGFVIPAPDLTKPVYDPSKPGEIPVVGFNDVLAWNTVGDGSGCAHFHKLIITRESDGAKIEAVDAGTFSLSFPLEQWTTAKNPPQEKIWKALDSVYTWKVQPCFIKGKNDLECESTISNTWKFKTTGAIPLHPQSEITNKVNLLWDVVKGAGSYKYQVANNNTFSSIAKEGTLLESKATLSHPDILPEKNYWWQIASCVDSTGVICGAWTAPQQFTTLLLNPPPAPTQPINGGATFLPGSLSWQPDAGSSYYQYHASYLSLAPDETLEGCQEKVGTQLIQPFPITQQTSFFLNEKCAGEYQWAVRSCADKACVLATDWSQSQLWTFTGKEGPVEEQPGLVPCGRSKNDPATPYNEKEDCGLQHLGFLLQNLLDFILWKVSLFVLLILAVITGATSYFSLGGPNALARIKTVFRSFFVGFFILMFAWMFVNIILMLFGFHFEFFGRWWEISF